MGVYIKTSKGVPHKHIDPGYGKKLKEGDLVLLVSDSKSDLILAVFESCLGAAFKAHSALFLKQPTRFNDKWIPNTEEIIDHPEKPFFEYLVDRFYFGNKEIINAIKSMPEQWHIYSVLI